MRLPSAAYGIIYRVRRRDPSLFIDTRARTVEIPYGIREAEIPAPVMRLRDGFGFVIQFYAFRP